MSRRGRAIIFAGAAAMCAAGAAAIAGDYRSAASAQLGELRPAVIATSAIDEGMSLAPKLVAAGMEVRRVPARFVPPDTLVNPAEAIGLKAGAPIPAGSYVLASQLGPSKRGEVRAAGIPPGSRVVELTIAGGGALGAAGSAEGSLVDVVVADPPAAGGKGSARVVAPAARLLALRGPVGPGGGWAATLAVPRRDALELIAADSFAREIRLLPR